MRHECCYFDFYTSLIYLFQQFTAGDDLKTLIYDAHQFTVAFFGPISQGALQVYHSALPFTPQDTLLYKNFQGELDTTIQVRGSIEKTWDSCIRVLEGHVYLVLCIAFSPNGQQIASGGLDLEILLWDTCTGAQTLVLEGHESFVTCVDFSPNGRILVSGSYDTLLRIWDVLTGAQRAVLTGHTGWMTCVRFSPDSTLIVSSAEDHSVRLWDNANGTCLGVLEGHSATVTGVVFSVDSRCIFSSSEDRTVMMWDVENRTFVEALRDHNSPVHSVAVSANGKYLASGSRGEVRIWDPLTGVHITMIGPDPRLKEAFSISFSPDSNRIFIASGDILIFAWDLVADSGLQCLFEAGQYIAASPDGHFIAVPQQNMIKLWDLRVELVKRAHPNFARRITCSPDGKHVASTSEDSITLWDGHHSYRTLSPDS